MKDQSSEFLDSYEAPEGFEVHSTGLFAYVQCRRSVERVRVCDWINVIAEACLANGERRSLVLDFRAEEGTHERKVIERKALLGTGTVIIAELVGSGLVLADRQKSPRLLLDCLFKWNPKKKLRLADGLGWQVCGKAFALPNGRVIGDEKIILEAMAPGPSEMGTLAGWRDDLSRFCIGNTDLILAVSASLAACLLRPLHLPGGGLHFYGPSSSGKTSLLVTAASVWSAPSTIGTWRTTDSALEKQAALHNDRALFLDEFAQIDPLAADRVLYMLGNGRGKDRFAASGLQWTVMTLSTGEISVPQKLAEAGKVPMDGQVVRMLDIPVGDQAFGVFGNLHDAPDGRTFSDRLRANATEHYGTAGPALLKAFVEDRDMARKQLIRSMEQFHDDAKQQAPEFDEGLHGRARDRFAVIAAAGEFASAHGITGWPSGTATTAALERFLAWCASIGPGPQARARAAAAAKEQADQEAAVERLRLLLVSHHNKIIDLDSPSESHPAHPVAWKKHGYFYVPPAVWKLIYDDPKHARVLLLRSGFLIRGDGANIPWKVPRGVIGTSRAYKISTDILP